MFETRRPGIIRRTLRGPTAIFAVLLLALLVVLAAIGPFVVPQNPYDLAEITILDAKLPPGSRASAGFVFWAGSDGQGRDLVSAMIYGLRLSLVVGVGSGAVALLLGGATGLLAGYLGGRFDAFSMRLADLMLGFPAIFVALMLLAAIGRGLGPVMLALVLVQWAPFARVARSAAMAETAKGYVMAASALGVSARQIVVRHLLPNCLPPIIVVGGLQVANAIAVEATLSFLGVGMPTSQPSLGLLIANGYEFVFSGFYWISLFPGLLLLALVLSINLIGDRLRDVLNPRLR